MTRNDVTWLMILTASISRIGITIGHRRTHQERTRIRSRINERNHDITSAVSGRKPLMLVSQATRMHEHPAEPYISDAAVVSEEPRSTPLQPCGNYVLHEN